MTNAANNKLLSPETASIEARFKLDRHDGDALKAIREVVSCHFYNQNHQIQLQLINKILDMKGE